MEFVAIFGFLLLVFVLFQVLFFNSKDAAQQERAALWAQKTAKEIAAKINLVSESTGMRTQFEVTQNLGDAGLAYYITVTNSTVSVGYNYGGTGKNAHAPVRVRTINNGAGSAVFNLSTGFYWANNTGGIIYVVKKS